MNAASQIVESEYHFILKTCRSIKRKGSSNPDEAADLAHDIIEKILRMDGDTLDRLKQNPRAYITFMLRNKHISEKRQQTVLEKFRVDALYSRKPGEPQQDVFDLGECTSDATDPKEREIEIANKISDKVAKIKGLNQTDKMWLAIFITYPETLECARITNINRNTIYFHKQRLKNLLKR